MVLIGAVALHLDRTAFGVGEATIAAIALGPLDREDRVPEATPADALIRGFGMAITTTERGLRLLVALGLILAALVTGETAARILGSATRPLAWLVFAAHPFVARTDLLYPGLLSPLPIALMIGGIVYLRGGSDWWAVGAVLGAAGAAVLDAHAQVCAIAAVVVVPLCVRDGDPARRLRLIAAQLVAGVGAWGAAGAPFAAERAVANAPGLLDLIGIGGSAPELSEGLPAVMSLLGEGLLVPVVLFGGLAYGLVRQGGRSAVRWGLAGLGVVLLVVAAPLATGSGWRPGPGLSALLPPAALALASALSRHVRALAVAGGLLLVVAIIGMVRAAPTWNDSKPGALQHVLDRARSHAAPGGRLVLWGEDRFAMLYYLRRGHDPGVPVLLVPEDTPMDDAALLLREQLRAEKGREHVLPPVLICPRTVPPGMELLPLAWADEHLAPLRLSKE